MKRWGISMDESKAIWARLKKEIDAMQEDEVSLIVSPKNADVDKTPFDAEVQDVYQIGELGSDQGWRTLHQGLQFALKREFARRRYELSNKEKLKVSDGELMKRAVVSMVFLGEREVNEGRLHVLENPKVKPMLTYTTVNLDEMCLTPSTSSIPLPLRVAQRKLREPLHQNEPLELPESDELSWTLAAHYGLEHERPIPRFSNAPRSAAVEPLVGGHDGGHDDGPDAGGGEPGAAPEPDLSLDAVEAAELNNLKALQVRRREARSTALREAAMKRKHDAGWVLTASGMWMYPGIVNKSWKVGTPPPPKPQSEADVAQPLGAAVAPAGQPTPPGACTPPPGPAVAVAGQLGAPGAGTPPPEPAGAAPESEEQSPEYLVAIPIKVKWLIECITGRKKTEYRKLHWYKPRFLKEGRPATQVKLIVGKGENPPYATYKVAKCEVVCVADVPPGAAPEPGTAEHVEVFGGEEHSLAIHLGELLATSPSLRERYVGVDPSELQYSPGCLLKWVSRAASRELADALVAVGGWHLWHGSLTSVIGSRVVVTHDGRAVGSAEVLQSVQIGTWRPRAGGYKWLPVRQRQDVDKASWIALVELQEHLGGAPEAYAVQVANCKVFEPVAFAHDGGDLTSINMLSPQEERLLKRLEGEVGPDEWPAFKLETLADHTCMQLVLLSGFVPLTECARYSGTCSLARPKRFDIIGGLALRSGGLVAHGGAAVLTSEFFGNQNSEYALTGETLNSHPDGPHTHFARAACVAIQLAFATRVFRAQLDAADRRG